MMQNANLEALTRLALTVGFLDLLFAGAIGYALRRRGARAVIRALGFLSGALSLICVAGFLSSAMVSSDARGSLGATALVAVLAAATYAWHVLTAPHAQAGRRVDAEPDRARWEW